MMDIEALLEGEIQRQDEEAREAIEGKTRDELVDYARSYISHQPENLDVNFLRRCLCDFLDGNACPRETIAFVEQDGHAYEALRTTIKRFRQLGKSIPPDIKDYILDTELKVRERPNKKIRNRTIYRNRQICECICYITRFSGFRAQRSPASNHGDCAVAIVADALSRGYDIVEGVWKNRGELGIGENWDC